MQKIYQQKILVIKELYFALYIIDSIVNVYIYNNLDLMIEYYNRSTWIKKFISDGKLSK